MGLFEGLQNLFRGISKGRSDDSDKLPVVSSVGLDESDGTLRFTVADDQMQVDMIWNLLTEQIGECRNQQLPKPLPNPDDLFRPTLIGAWAEDRLVGGAFVMPDLEDSAYYAAAGHGDAAEFLAVRTAMVQGIAVLPRVSAYGCRCRDQTALRLVGRTARLCTRVVHRDERRRGSHERESRLSGFATVGHARR